MEAKFLMVPKRTIYAQDGLRFMPGSWKFAAPTQNNLYSLPPKSLPIGRQPKIRKPDALITIL